MHDYDGITVWPTIIPPRLITAALRRLNIEVVKWGLSAEDLAKWASTTAFPWLRFDPAIIALRDWIEGYLYLHDVDWCEPQIIYRYPDLATEWPITYHVDEDSMGEMFGGIFAVPLTSHTENDGCLIVENRKTGTPRPIEVQPRDILRMQPWVKHAAGLNKGGNVRVCIYFRHE